MLELVVEASPMHPLERLVKHIRRNSGELWDLIEMGLLL